MDREDRQAAPQPASQESAGASISPSSAAWSGLRKRLVQAAGATLVLGLAALACFIFLRHNTPNGHAQQPVPLFINWGRPDLALVLSGEMHGYLQPCGCSSPQVGGLARRFHFLKTLRDKNWPVLALDLGDIAQATGPQALLKYTTAMRALNAMGYGAIGIGLREFNMPLAEALANYSINHASPRPLVRNLHNAQQPGEEFYELNVRGSEVFELKKDLPRIGVIGLVSPSVAAKVKDSSVSFMGNAQVLPAALKTIAAKKADLNVILYQGTEREAQEAAKYCDKLQRDDNSVPKIHVILCLADGEEPPGMPSEVKGTVAKTQIIMIGHKGRYVGVVGVWRKDKSYELKYQLVSMSQDFDTPRGKEKENSILALMEEYALTLKRENFLAKFPRSEHPMTFELKQVLGNDAAAKFAGSEMCGNCHAHAYKVWQESKHAHAFDALVKATRPANKQFDGECVVCHTVGFSYHTGYFDPKNAPKQNARLLHVGCESCHGPAAAHANNPDNKALYPLINPWKGIADSKKRLAKIDQDLCQKCHDLENDVHWAKVPFESKWIEQHIIHMTPRKSAAK